MRESDAAALLAEVREARTRARSRLPGIRFPMLLFGCLAVVSALIAFRYGVGWHGRYWSVAGPLGSLATALFYARSGRRIGFEVPAAPYVTATAVIVGGAALSGIAGGVVGEPMLGVAGPPFAVAAGLLLFARIERTAPLARFAVALAALDAALLVGGVGAASAAVVLSLAYGVPAILLGLSDQRRPARG